MNFSYVGACKLRIFIFFLRKIEPDVFQFPQHHKHCIDILYTAQIAHLKPTTRKKQLATNFNSMKNINKLTLFSVFVAAMFFTSGNGQAKRELRNGDTSGFSGQPRLIETQMSQSGDNVHFSLQDKKGNLWFATTSNGVYRYDGKAFTNFTVKDGLVSNSVSCILQDRKGDIWFGTFSGLSRFDGKVFSHILSTNFFVYSISEDSSGRLWISTNSGVYWYNGKDLTGFLENQNVINPSGLKLGRVNSMLEDKHGNIWFTTTSEGVCRYDGKSIVNYTPNKELYFWGLMEDSNGNIWVGGRNTGVSRFDGKTYTKISQNGIFDLCIAFSIIQDKTGNIWFGTEAIDASKRETEGGLWVYDGRSFKNFLKKDGLTNNAVWSILEDKSGNLWIGTRNTGLSRYDGKTFTNFSQ